MLWFVRRGLFFRLFCFFCLLASALLVLLEAPVSPVHLLSDDCFQRQAPVFCCAGYLVHPFVKWMVLVLIAPFFSQLLFFTDEEVQEHFAYLHACSESHPLPQRR